MQSIAGTEQACAERECLILGRLAQVRLIARRIHDKVPGCVSLEDLVSSGVVGLISAVDNFDPARNVKLGTYAEHKIRGAILDSLRNLDWASRERRQKAKQIEAAIAAAEQRLGRGATEEEIAAELQLGLEQYHQWLVEIRGLTLNSLDYTSDREDGKDLLELVSDSEEHWPSRLLEASELERLLAEAIGRMPPVERTVLSLYYKEELTLREIAGVMQLHLSRVSQLKSQAVLRLRAYIEKRWPVEHGR
jgi:RNA polymerase sigma factor for flagellar operon FliA